MKKEYLVVFALLVVVGTIAIVLINRNRSGSQIFVNDTPAQIQTNTQKITYTAAGYSPKTLTIKAGETVTFVNQSESLMWVASDPHPIHTNFPAFDQRQGVGRDETYDFTFSQGGTYSYHNHLAPQNTATILVE